MQVGRNGTSYLRRHLGPHFTSSRYNWKQTVCLILVLGREAGSGRAPLPLLVYFKGEKTQTEGQHQTCEQTKNGVKGAKAFMECVQNKQGSYSSD